MFKSVFNFVAISFLLMGFGQYTYAQVSDGLNVLKNKLEKAVKDAVPNKTDRASKDSNKDRPATQGEDVRTEQLQSGSLIEGEKISQRSADSLGSGKATLPEPSHDGWKNANEAAKKDLREVASAVHSVYSNGVRRHFQGGFLICERGVRDSLDEEVKNIRASAKNLDSKKEILKREEEADGLMFARQFVARIHCLNRVMFTLTSMKSGLASPVLDDWIKGTKNFDFEDLTPAAVKKINEQLSKSHEDFIQGDIQMLKITDEQRRNAKNRANISSKDITEAGVARMQIYLSSYKAVYNALNQYFVASAQEFGCKVSKDGQTLVVCE